MAARSKEKNTSRGKNFKGKGSNWMLNLNGNRVRDMRVAASSTVLEGAGKFSLRITSDYPNAVLTNFKNDESLSSNGAQKSQLHSAAISKAHIFDTKE